MELGVSGMPEHEPRPRRRPGRKRVGGRNWRSKASAEENLEKREKGRR